MVNERVEMANGLVQQDIQLSLYSFIGRPQCPAIFMWLNEDQSLSEGVCSRALVKCKWKAPLSEQNCARKSLKEIVILPKIKMRQESNNILNQHRNPIVGSTPKGCSMKMSCFDVWLKKKNILFLWIPVGIVWKLIMLELEDLIKGLTAQSQFSQNVQHCTFFAFFTPTDLTSSLWNKQQL